MIEKKAITQVPINALLSQRWSGRAYNPDKAVSRALLITLLEAARCHLPVSAINHGDLL